MRTWSISVGRLFGIEVRLHLTFFLLLMFVWFTQPPDAGAAGVARGLVLVGMVFGSVVLHELGHALVATRERIPPRVVILLPIGGMALTEDPFPRDEPATGAEAAAGEAPRWLREVRVALAGPLVNFMIAFIAAAVVLAVAPEVALWARPPVGSGALLRSLVWINAFLGAFNVLPAYPLDGGRVLRALLARRMPQVEATYRAVFLGRAFSMLFIFAGLWNIWLMLVGFFLFAAAQLEERTAMMHSVIEHVRMEDVMLTDFATLSPADTLEDALHKADARQKAANTPQDAFPVVRGTDLVGVISRQSIAQALRADGNDYVQSAMNRTWDVAQRHESLASAFRKITARGHALVPVVEDEWLVGIVTMQILTHSMTLLAQSKRQQPTEPA